MHHKIFSWKRIGLLIKRYFLLNLNAILLAAAAILGCLLAIMLLKTYFNDNIFNEAKFVSELPIYFFVIGALFTLGIFKELRTFNKGWFYMILPASPFEKFFAAWIISSVGYFLLATILLLLVSLLFSLVATILLTPTFFVFNPFEQAFLDAIKHYLIWHSVFFLGAIAFRSHNFFKTILSILAVAALVVVITVLSMRLIYNSWENVAITAEILAENTFLVNRINQIGTIFYYFLIAPFLLIVSYFKFREKEF